MLLYYYMQEQHFVYILRSKKTGRFYKGVSKHPELRLEEHNRGKNPSTKAEQPWQMVHLESFNSRADALIRERQIKKWRSAMVESLING